MINNTQKIVDGIFDTINELPVIISWSFATENTIHLKLQSGREYTIKVCKCDK